MKTLVHAAIRCSLIFAAVAALSFAQPAQAYTVTLEQMGANVVATGSGAINLTGLQFVLSGGVGPGLHAGVALIQTGPLGSSSIDVYTGFTGPTSFGSGGTDFTPNIGSGDFVGIFGFIDRMQVPHNYVSGTNLMDSMTFNGATFASLGVTPGTYVWTWGAGADQRFTLIIGPAGVPDGGSTVSLLGCALLGLAALRRKLSC